MNQLDFVATNEDGAASLSIEMMLKRLFKVAELLSSHNSKMDDCLDENGHQNPVPQENEYCETSDLLNRA